MSAHWVLVTCTFLALGFTQNFTHYLFYCFSLLHPWIISAAVLIGTSNSLWIMSTKGRVDTTEVKGGFLVSKDFLCRSVSDDLLRWSWKKNVLSKYYFGKDILLLFGFWIELIYSKNIKLFVLSFSLPYKILFP